MPIFMDEDATGHHAHTPKPLHPRAPTSSTVSAFLEYPRDILSPEFKATPSSTSQVHPDYLVTCRNNHNNSMISPRSRSQSVPVTYSSMIPSPPKSTLPIYSSSNVPVSFSEDHTAESCHPLTSVTPPSFARSPKLPTHGPYSDLARFPSPRSYTTIPGLVASGSSTTSARSSAYTSSGVNALLSSIDLSALGTGLGSFQDRENTSEMSYVEDKEWEIGASTSSEAVMSSVYTTSASHPRPLLREASESSTASFPFAVNTTTSAAVKALNLIHESYSLSTQSGKLDGSPTPFVRSNQHLKQPSTWREVGAGDIDREHDRSQLHSHLPLVNNISQRSDAETTYSSRSTSISSLTSASEDEIEACEYPYPQETDEGDEGDEEARTAAIVVAEEGRGLIVHGEGQEVSAVNIPAGTTHLLLMSSATPDLIPSLLSQVLPNIAHTLLALDISSNCLGALPPSLADCTQLTELNITSNPLYILPIWLSNLERLRVLIADATGIITLPPELAALRTLNVLSIRRNKMMFLPPWLAFLPALEQLNVEGNPFQGPWKALLSPLTVERRSVPPSTPSDILKFKTIHPRRDHSLYGPGLSMHADALSHMSTMPSDLQSQIITPHSATNSFFGTTSSEPEPPTLSLNARGEEDNTILSPFPTSPSQSSLFVVPLAPLTGNSQRGFSAPLNSPSLLPYTTSPVNHSGSDTEEALADIGKNAPSPVQRVPVFSVSDRRTPLPCLHPLLRNHSTPNRSRLSVGSTSGSIATFVADQRRSRTSSAASRRPLTDYTSSRYNERSATDSGFYGNAIEYASYERQSESSDFFGLRSDNPNFFKLVIAEETRKELRRMRSADQLGRAFGSVVGSTRPITPKSENDDDNGGEITETDRRPHLFAQTADVGTIGPGSRIVLNDRLTVKKYPTLTAAQGLPNTPVQKRRPILTKSLFDGDAGIEGDAEDGDCKTQVVSGFSRIETPQKPLKGKWGFLKKMSMGRMRLDPSVPRPTQYANGLLPLRSTHRSPRPKLPSAPISPGSTSRTHAVTRDVLNPISSFSVGTSSVPASFTQTHTPPYLVPPTTSRAAKRRSFLPLDGPPSLNIPIPATSPFFTDELVTPLEQTEEEHAVTDQRHISVPTGLIIEKDNSSVQYLNQARALRGVMAYLRDMADLSVSSAAFVGQTSGTMPSSANLASIFPEGTDGPLRRPTLVEGSRLVTESITSSPHVVEESRVYTMSMAATDGGWSGKEEEERGKYKEDKSRRVKIMREIVQTEQTYVKGLQELIDIYVKPAAQPLNTLGNAVAGTKETVIPQQERKMVFNGLDSLYSFHTQSFLPALERAAKPIIIQERKEKSSNAEADSEISAEVSIDAAVAIARVFVSYAAFMKMYSTYINNFDSAFERLKHWTHDSRVPGSLVVSPNASTAHLAGPGSNVVSSNESNSSGLHSLTSNQRKRIKQYLKRCRMNPQHSQINLEAYLLLPVQRIPRYRMLLDELVRCTPPKPNLLSDVMERALSEIALLANNMNEGKREAESRRRLVQWQARIRGKFPSPLVQPHRRLIMDGSLTLTRVVRKTSMAFNVTISESDATTVQVECLAPEETPRSLVGILCNDLLVLCKDSSGGQDQTAQVDLWAVLRMQTRPLPASIAQGNSLRIVDNKAILYFDIPSSSEALTWCRAINMHIPVTF